jgi:transcriptional regulator with PAS, ATPase and Fis domain
VRAKKVDARILCSTNQDLEALAAQDRFRKDLHYRVNAVEIKIPPLRERPEDIESPVQAHHPAHQQKNRQPSFRWRTPRPPLQRAAR